MIYLVLILLGLCLGSFVNAFVWRLHTKRDWVKARSECVHCHHVLSAKDLVPVFSWMALGGKCRYCKKPISTQYPVVELAMAVLFVFSYTYWPYEFNTVSIIRFALWLLFVVGFVILTVYDLKWMLLPNKVVYALTGLAVTQTVLVAVITKNPRVILESLIGFLVVGGLFYVLFQVSKGKWIGGGDVKLGFLLGILVGGPANGLLLLFTASITGTLVSLPLLATGKAKKSTRIPFGPFLLLATIIVQLFGVSIVTWYKTKFLF